MLILVPTSLPDFEHFISQRPNISFVNDCQALCNMSPARQLLPLWQQLMHLLGIRPVNIPLPPLKLPPHRTLPAMSFTFRPTAVSAPGKVLLAGGYLVLDPQYTGLVFALNARIHCVSSENPGAEANTITVRSPQFTKEPEWVFSISAGENGAGTAVKQISGQVCFSPYS